MMTKAQIFFYRSMWSSVKSVYMDLGGFSAAEAEEQRHALTVEAIGYPKSSTEFTDEEFDKVLDAFREILTIEWGPHKGPTRAQEMPRLRLIFAIRKIGLPDSYLNEIAADEFKVEDWHALPVEHLEHLRFTAGARARAKAKQERRPA